MASRVMTRSGGYSRYWTLMPLASALLDGVRRCMRQQMVRGYSPARLATPRSELIGKVLEVGFVYRLQHLGCRALYDLILQSRNTDLLAAIGLWSVDPPYRLRMIR